MESSSQTLPTLAVHVLSGHVLRERLVCSLTPREMELAVALALQGPRRTESLVEDLWPESTGDRATSILKVNVHRLRAKTAHAFVESKHGCYALRDSVHVDVFAMQRRLEAALNDLATLHVVDATYLDIARELRVKRPARASTWSWFAPHCQRFSAFGRGFTMRYARCALQKGDYEKALSAARELTLEDECDEEARELIIRSHLRRGEHGAALQEFRRYSRALARDIGSEPSSNLRELFLSA